MADSHLPFAICHSPFAIGKEFSMSFNFISLLGSVIVGYLLGSVPSGFIWVKVFTGQDVRTVGSGRTGGTNVYRAAGRTAFLLTIVSDIGKGFVAVLIANALWGSPWYLFAAFFALVGNNWSLFLRGHGGAGVMTASGTMFAIAPVPVLLIGWFPVLLVWLTRIASIGSLAAAVLIPLWFGVLTFADIELLKPLKQPTEHFIYLLAAGALLIVVHAPNIQRLREGRERKIGEPAKKN
jgi:glycerol-3-phosphate acyltransferase PlsY